MIEGSMSPTCCMLPACARLPFGLGSRYSMVRSGIDGYEGVIIYADVSSPTIHFDEPPN